MDRKVAGIQKILGNKPIPFGSHRKSDKDFAFSLPKVQKVFDGLKLHHALGKFIAQNSGKSESADAVKDWAKGTLSVSAPSTSVWYNGLGLKQKLIIDLYTNTKEQLVKIPKKFYNNPRDFNTEYAEKQGKKFEELNKKTQQKIIAFSGISNDEDDFSNFFTESKATALEMEICPKCDGNGYVWESIRRFEYSKHGYNFSGKDVPYKQICPRCNGKGKISKKNFNSPSRNKPNAYDDLNAEPTSREFVGIPLAAKTFGSPTSSTSFKPRTGSINPSPSVRSISATAAGTPMGAVKGWLTRKFGKTKAKRKKGSKLLSIPLHKWAKHQADLMIIGDPEAIYPDFEKRFGDDYQQAYRIAYTAAKKLFR
jgi:hypothetical protein